MKKIKKTLKNILDFNSFDLSKKMILIYLMKPKNIIMNSLR